MATLADGTEVPEDTSLPSYLVAADAHNIANNNDSWFDAATLGTAGVIGSATVQLLNVAPTIGNWMGGDFAELKTKEVLNDFDSDLGKYYERHQEGIDALGFMLGSVVPGMAGVKVLKAGQAVLRSAAEAGNLGKGLEAAFGLMKTEPKLLAQAVEAALKPNAGFPIFNSQTVKAMAAGFGQAALEGAAWETAVAATMYNGPVLQGQDFGDITSNILHSSLAFGVLGGTLHTAGIYSKIKSAGKDFDSLAMPWNIVRESPQSATTSEKILNLFDEFHSMPAVPTDRFVGEEAWKATKLQGMADDKGRYIDTKIRSLTGELASGDQTLAEHLYTQFKSMNLGQVEAKLFGSESTTRIFNKSAAEQALTKIDTELAKTTDIADAANFEYWATRSRTYVKLNGEGAGKVLSESPKVYNLGDTLAVKGGVADTISVTAKGVTAGARSFDFGLTKAWDILGAGHLEAEARQIWASKLTSFAKVEAETGVPVTIGGLDIPLLDKAFAEGVVPRVQLAGKEGVVTFQGKEEFRHFLENQKSDLYEFQVKQGASLEEAAKIANISEQRASGMVKLGTTEGLFAREAAEKAYNDMFVAAGRKVPGEFYDQPTWAKTIKDSSQVKDVDGNVLDGLVAIKQKQVFYENAADRAVAPIYGDSADAFTRVSDTLLNRMNRTGPGGGMLSAQNENYGTLGSMCQYLGAQTLKLVNKVQSSTREGLQSTLYKLGQNQGASIEWSVLQQKLRQFGATGFGYDAEQQAMRPLALMKYERTIAGGTEAEMPVLAEGIPDLIPIKNAEVAELVQHHMGLNAGRNEKLGAIRTNQGVKWNRDPERFYPIPPNTRDYPFIASVIDDSIAGAGHGKMLYAATSADLEAQITAVRAADSTLKVLTKKDAETWYKSIGQYEYERTLTDVSFDSTKIAKGTSAGYLPSTDPSKIIADTLNWHLQRDATMVREAVAHQNEAQIATLRGMGEKYANVQGSHFSNLDPLSYLEMQGKNPYADYARSMLGLSTSKEFPFWTPMNDMLDRKVSGLFNKVYETFANAKSPAELEVINKQLAEAGYQGAAYSAMTVGYANHTAPKGALSAFVGKANAILSSCMLGLDPMNSVANVVGGNVLRNTELQALIRSIKQGNSATSGDLAALSHVRVPGTDATIFSPLKMIGNAMKDFHSVEGKALRAEFQARGVISSRVEQANWVIDNLALTGKESAADLDGVIGKVWAGLKTAREAGEKITGNALAEEFNRFVSGHVAKQITDKAVEAGVLAPKEAWAYINTFVNRVEGNYIAAQRPGVFQGPIGQAIGLFQTYQFNLAQQLLRHVGEGSGKDAAVMMGLQSTIFGMKGLPAFDAINTTLIGNASGNKNHRDMFDAVYGAAGKEAGDWLMYGVGSNALGLISPELKANLYSRGDINPRNVTLLPVNPANIPFVQAAGKFFGSVQETATKLGQGGAVWSSILQGIEHAGISRPLAGLAQTLEALGNPQARSFSTSNKGNVVASNDFLSLTNMIRIAGAKPMDEAIGTDRAFNLEAYASQDTKRRQMLGESIKTTLIAGQNPSEDQVNKFAYLYARSGGKQEHFNQFMIQQFKDANTSQVNSLADNLKKPFAQSMQQMLGTNRLKDFTNTPQ